MSLNGKNYELNDICSFMMLAADVYLHGGSINIEGKEGVFLQKHSILCGLPTLRTEYTEFFNAVVPHVREKFPGVIVGSKITYDGLINIAGNAKRLNNLADAVLLTYYPLNQGEFTVHDPSTIHDDFKRIIELYPDKKIYFSEIGYPSGELNASSEEKQADFIRQTFLAWDIYKSRVPLLNFQWLHDASPATIAGWQSYYGSKDK